MKVTEIIEEHRLKLPLEKGELTYYSSWEQIFGTKGSDYSHEERFERWTLVCEELKKFNPEMVKYWNDPITSNETCLGCIHRSESKIWCNGMGLPCNFNPITQILGMACMGTGYQKEE
ncbi:hypothetical protein [Flagellimonas sp. CMM7]|nr:hypothetical protein [Flagellimonas sp. CMM7]